MNVSRRSWLGVNVGGGIVGVALGVRVGVAEGTAVGDAMNVFVGVGAVTIAAATDVVASGANAATVGAARVAAAVGVVVAKPRFVKATRPIPSAMMAISTAAAIGGKRTGLRLFARGSDDAPAD